MVGNGVTNWKWDGNPTLIETGFWFNTFGPSMHDSMIKNNRTYFFEEIEGAGSAVCSALEVKFFSLISSLNFYDLYGRCLDACKPLNLTTE